MNALCVVVDGLPAGLLGCYGSDGGATPAIDRLACEGFVFDHASIDGPRLADFYRAAWQGRHALAPAMESGAPTLAASLSAAGVSTTLWTDEPELAQLAGSADFAAAEYLAFDAPAIPAERWDETQTAQLFAAAADWLASARPPFLLWLHARGPAGPWDAPLDLRRQFADEADIEPYAAVDVPSRLLSDDHDPDEVLAVRWACAAQVAVVDRCLEALLAALADAGGGVNALVSVQSCRGFGLGEHRWIGPADAAPRLHEEAIHIPWLLRLPMEELGPGRSQALVQPADLPATLRDAFGLPAGERASGASLLPLVRGERDAVRDRACIVAGRERGLRTAGWYLRWRQPPEDDSSAAAAADSSVDCQLFAKPDDRWEVNDVADRLPYLVEPLLRGFDACRAHLDDPLSPLPPLEEPLLAEPT